MEAGLESLAGQTLLGTRGARERLGEGVAGRRRPGQTGSRITRKIAGHWFASPRLHPFPRRYRAPDGATDESISARRIGLPCALEQFQILDPVHDGPWNAHRL